jgi:hypothetical protein
MARLFMGKYCRKDVGGSGSGPFGRCADNCQVQLQKSTKNSSHFPVQTGNLGFPMSLHNRITRGGKFLGVTFLRIYRDEKRIRYSDLEENKHSPSSATLNSGDGD